MFTRAVITLFSWALVLEVIVLVYYLWRGFRPVEFYLDFGLLAFTVPFLVFLAVREKKRRDEDGKGE
ncbi:hypothetical protein [Thermotoga sp. SG1]|uniref:TM0026 family membrane protein n=1 Tax=Thermotoga sp. SG1 TaxID=126739 RepID=UPI000C76C35E|nr:hypothetical protein [Thermotoga sp. SG1]PLV57690.1 hypothetical protein AS006_02115 [Thermotoga sp. SG1]